MRSAFCFLVVHSVLIIASCKDQGTKPDTPYEAMLFERFGGGNLKFTMTPYGDGSAFGVAVTRVAYRDTSIRLTIAPDPDNRPAYDMLMMALRGECRLAGDFRESSYPKGTWARIYMVKGDHYEEVTNTRVRDILMHFEQIVRGKL